MRPLAVPARWASPSGRRNRKTGRRYSSPESRFAMDPALPLRVLMRGPRWATSCPSLSHQALIRSAPCANFSVDSAPIRSIPPTRDKRHPKLAPRLRREHSLLRAASAREGSKRAQQAATERRSDAATQVWAVSRPRFHLFTLSPCHVVTKRRYRRHTRRLRDSVAFCAILEPRHPRPCQGYQIHPTKAWYCWYSSVRGLETC
jgi:hypothetical protein